MLDFLKIKLYRRSFRTYILGLSVVFLIAFSILGIILINKTVDSRIKDAEVLFQRCEDEILKRTQDIEEYIIKLYNNELLMQDFRRFFGYSAKEYISKRIEDSKANDNMAYFIGDVQGFITESNYSINTIYFKKESTIIKLSLDEKKGLQLSYNILESEYTESLNRIETGYAYVRDLRETTDMAENMGTVAFILNNEKTFQLIKQAGYDCAAVYDKNSIVYLTNTNGGALVQPLEELRYATKSSGVWSGGLFDKIYYSKFSSDDHNYHLIVGFQIQNMLLENIPSFVIITIGLIILFLLVASIIAANMSVDAAVLNKIIYSINRAKKGEFERIEIKDREDEYGIIAKEINDMTDKLGLHIQKEYLLTIKQQKAEMEAMMYQINPHFLYNTFEIIRSYALQNKGEQVADALGNLGKMYRGMVKEEAVITIGKELNLLHYYLEIMSFKHEDNFYYQIDVAESVKDMETIKFWMQPIVENFFIHGFDKNKEYNLIIIQGEEYEDYTCIRIIDNGRGRTQEAIDEINLSMCEEDEKISNSHIGLRNVYQRLQYFYENKLKMTLIKNQTSGITVEVIIYK